MDTQSCGGAEKVFVGLCTSESMKFTLGTQHAGSTDSNTDLIVQNYVYSFFMTLTIAVVGIFPMYYSLHLRLLHLANVRCMQNTCVVSAYQIKGCRALSWIIAIVHPHRSENWHV